MFEGFDQDELLAYVEDGLDPAGAADLRRRLAAHPQAARALERLREDRALLRSLEAPPAPPDLMAELEPMLARPMLMPRQTDWRRRYRRRRRWPLVAAAACFALLVPAALWALSAGWRAPGGPLELAQAPAEVAHPRPAPGPSAVAPGIAPAAGAAAPAQGDRDPAPQAALGTPPAARAPRPPGEPPKFAPADLLLVVRAADESAVAESLRRSLEELGVEGALVRNFTIDEARALAPRSGRGEPRPEGPGAVARAEGGEAAEPGMGAVPLRPGQRAQPSFEEPAAPVTASAQLWGARELAPGYEKQLEFSQRGAAYTVSIPAGRLADLLARLELQEGHQAALRVASGPPPGLSEPLLWLRDYPRVRAALESLRADPDAVIFMPVALEKAP